MKALVLKFGLAAVLAVGFSTAALAQSGAADEKVPGFTYDSTWPKLPLPNKWTFEGITGLAVDKDNVIWVLNRPGDYDVDPIFHIPERTENYAALNPPTALCCLKPEGILAFDMQGNLLHHWNQVGQGRWPSDPGRSRRRYLGRFRHHAQIHKGGEAAWRACRAFPTPVRSRAIIRPIRR